jgi:CheY-like chemotaxis protein
MDGHEATRLIQAFEQENGITPKPIIALTGHALKNDREECLKAGMCDYLSKPVKQLDLLDKLNHWLSEDKNSSAAVA